MGRTVRALVGGLAIVVVGGAAVAAAVTLDPEGGAPGSAYRADVPCDVEPQVYVVDLDAGAPPATLVPEVGTESSPGVWTYERTAGPRDDRITSICEDRREVARYDVDLPVLLPGPTVADFGSYRPDLEGSTVVGTDCPEGTEARATFRGDGAEIVASAPIDAYGDWEVAVPAAAPAGPLVVEATCGDVAYEPITLARPGGSAPAPGPAPTPPAPAPTAAAPVAGEAAYTG